MTANTPQSKPVADLRQRIVSGTRGKLTVMGKRFGVEVLDVGEHAMRVSFPFAEWPPDGIRVDLDLPVETGLEHYRGTVAYEPETSYVAGLVLHDMELSEPEETQRGDCRVPTDLTFQVKETPHPRRFDAVVLNLSTGGALLRTGLPADSGQTLDIDLSLPGHGVESVPARVIHTAPDTEQPGVRLMGVRFVDTSPDTETAISDYIDHRLQAVC